MAPPIRIVLVEDNDVFREALELLLNLRSDLDVVACVASGDGVAEVCREFGPDVVLMDYRLPGKDGVEATAAVHEICPRTAVVCLTAAAEASEIDALYAAGATTCLTKDTQLDVLVQEIHRAAAGRTNAA